MEAKNISGKAKSVIDYSEIAFECGFFFNPIGNFSIIPFGDYYLASFRAFGYFITTEIQNYVFTPNMKLKEPNKYVFCLLDRDFHFVKQLKCVQSSYWEHPVWNKRLPYLEDMRMTIWDGQIYGMSTIIYQDEKKYAALGLQLQKIEVNGDFVSCQHVWNSLQVGM